MHASCYERISFKYGKHFGAANMGIPMFDEFSIGAAVRQIVPGFYP